MFKQELKKKVKKINRQQKEIDAKRIAEIDKKVDHAEKKTHTLSEKLFGKNITKWLFSGVIGRGILWLIQDTIIVMLGVGISMWLMTIFLPNFGNMLGHSAGLTPNAINIDQFNLMFNPLIYLDLMAVITEWALLKQIWKWLNRYFGKLRQKNAINHGLTDYNG